MKKTMVFAYNGSYGMMRDFVANLEHLGFAVIPFSVSKNFTYANKFQHAVSYFMKRFFKNNEIEKQRKMTAGMTELNAKIKEVGGKVDYILMIRPDDFPITFIKKLKNISGKMAAYQWDGFRLFPDAAPRVKYFDRFFVFDPKDLAEDKDLLPTTNFYFDYYQNQAQEKQSDTIYFFGTFINFRMETIANLTKYLQKIGRKTDINVVACQHDNIKKFQGSGIKFFETGISFEENIATVREAGVLVDFINGKHNGLSFRTFDAIGYDKKLITTNAHIVKYDFYRPENIFVLTEHNLQDLEEFLAKPYKPLPLEIKKKYGFTNWLNYVLDIPPYSPINLPNS